MEQLLLEEAITEKMLMIVIAILFMLMMALFLTALTGKGPLAK